MAKTRTRKVLTRRPASELVEKDIDFSVHLGLDGIDAIIVSKYKKSRRRLQQKLEQAAKAEQAKAEQLSDRLQKAWDALIQRKIGDKLAALRQAWQQLFPDSDVVWRSANSDQLVAENIFVRITIAPSEGMRNHHMGAADYKIPLPARLRDMQKACREQRARAEDMNKQLQRFLRREAAEIADLKDEARAMLATQRIAANAGGPVLLAELDALADTLLQQQMAAAEMPKALLEG